MLKLRVRYERGLMVAVVVVVLFSFASANSDLDLIASRVAASQLPPVNALASFDTAVARNLSFVLPNFTFSE